MKSKKLNIFIILLGILWLPKIAFAEELPKTGVHYYLTYPNQEEKVIDNYEEATNPQEKLLYTGITNNNGELILKDWQETGQLRIVEKVPEGYSTQNREYTVDLSEKKVEFINENGFNNPGTGSSKLLFYVLGITLVGLIFVVLDKKGKNRLLILPLFALFLMAYQTDALEDGFVIFVKDKEGNGIPNVEIEIYAKPNKVEAYPTLIYNANGGNFLDGSTELYLKLPHNNCTLEELFESLTEEQEDYFSLNINGVYRKGYYPTYEEEETPSEITDGMVFKINWEENEEAEVVTIHGNGGYFKIPGKKLEEITIYKNGEFMSLEKNLKNDDGSYYIGIDKTKECTNYENGIINTAEAFTEIPEDLYICWHKNPDGIYINDKPYIGNTTKCYQDLYYFGASDSIELYPYTLNNITNSSFTITQKSSEAEIIKNFKIIEDGKEIVNVKEDKITFSENENIITDQNSLSIINNYFEKLKTNCKD